MRASEKDAGTIQALLKRLNEQRLPRAIALQDKVNRGEHCPPAHALINTVASKYTVADIRIEDAQIEEVIARFYAMHGAVER